MAFEGEPIRVAISPNRFGDRLNKPGESYLLSNSFSPLSAMLGSDRYSEIYFRTSSDNIYLIDGDGGLLNSKRCAFTKTLDVVKVPQKYLAFGRLTVGLPFYYDYGNTTDISEIVTATSRFYSPEYIQEITEQRTSTILTDFYQILKRSGVN